MNEQALIYAREYIVKKEMLGIPIRKESLKDSVYQKLESVHSYSAKYQITLIKKELVKQGKSTTEILQILIAKFENESSITLWVENWKNYLALHQYAQTKPPSEQKTIESIISKADFASEDSFADTLSLISKSSGISTQTKLEIAQKFNTENISTVGAMDSALNQIRTRKKDVEKAIDIKTVEKETLQTEIENLEEELEALTAFDPKREEIDTKLKEKKGMLKNTEAVLQTLEDQKPNEVSFVYKDSTKRLRMNCKN